MLTKHDRRLVLAVHTEVETLREESTDFRLGACKELLSNAKVLILADSFCRGKSTENLQLVIGS
jgi:glutamine phosphoribosylpyrophosphate amidotransferase